MAASETFNALLRLYGRFCTL